MKDVKLGSSNVFGDVSQKESGRIFSSALFTEFCLLSELPPISLPSGT